MEELEKSLELLKNKINSLGKATVSFSGGVDSSLVAKIAYDTLKEKALAVTIKTEFISEEEIMNAINIAREIGIKHKIISINMLDFEEISDNPENRCYFCKLNIISNMPGKIILDGTNFDDDIKRPGLKALDEKGVISPLKENRITKEQVREMARYVGLTNHLRPSNSCLATRIPFNKKITQEKLSQIEADEKIFADNLIYGARVRVNENKILLEIPDDSKKDYLQVKEQIEKEMNKKINNQKIAINAKIIKN